MPFKMKTALLASLLSLTIAHPISDETTTELNDSTTTITDKKYVEDLKREIDNIAYKQNLKHVLTEYVLSEEKDLTLTEREKVRGIIEDLLQNIVRDFSIILKKDDIRSKDVIVRISDDMFDEIRKCVVLGIPGVSEYDASRLAYRLEQNLLRTRQKLDRLIVESRMARAENL